MKTERTDSQLFNKGTQTIEALKQSLNVNKVIFARCKDSEGKPSMVHPKNGGAEYGLYKLCAVDSNGNTNPKAIAWASAKIAKELDNKEFSKAYSNLEVGWQSTLDSEGKESGEIGAVYHPAVVDNDCLMGEGC